MHQVTDRFVRKMLAEGTTGPNASTNQRFCVFSQPLPVPPHPPPPHLRLFINHFPFLLTRPHPPPQVTDRFVRKMLAEEAGENERKREGKKGKGRGGRREHSRNRAGSAGGAGAGADGGSVSSALLHAPPPLPPSLNPLFFGSAVTAPSVADSAVASGSGGAAIAGVGFAAEPEAAYRVQRRKEELADLEKTLEQVKSLRADIARERQEEGARATNMAQALQAQQFR
ncbi:unnamed protein product [Closterium sp. NIES-65]|nr:unnamed protein product [Closterium sp. NIES-65]